ncbi:MAG: leucyl aminopeptidase family protein, partial [Nodosilinea sp.]
MHGCEDRILSGPIPLYLVTTTELATEHQDSQPWAQAMGFRAEANQVCLVPGPGGTLAKVLVGRGETLDTWTLGGMPQSLPPHSYYLAQDWPAAIATKLWLGW